MSSSDVRHNFLVTGLFWKFVGAPLEASGKRRGKLLSYRDQTSKFPYKEKLYKIFYRSMEVNFT